MNPITKTVKIESEGSYSIRVYKKDGTPVPEKTLENIGNTVTYAGAYDALFNSGIFASLTIAVGTGTTERTRSDTSLGNETHTGGSADAPVTGIATNGDGTATHTFTRSLSFALGAVVGTFSEVGLKRGSTLIAGQLIKDEFGNPTTVTVLADEQLKVEYTLAFTFPDNSLPVAPIVGTGQVTTPTGTSDYTIYSQPWFAAYVPTGNPAIDRWIRAADAGNVYVLYASSGSRLLMKAAENALSKSFVGDTVTYDFGELVLPPTALDSADIAYISIGGAATTSNATTSFSTTTKRVTSAIGGFGNLNSILGITEFSPPLTKTSSDTMKVRFTLEYKV